MYVIPYFLSPTHIVKFVQDKLLLFTIDHMICMLLWYFAKKVSSASWSVCKGSRTIHEGSFPRNVATNFKLHVRMGCIIINYITDTQIANPLHKLPVHESVCEPVHEPFHAPRVSSRFICFHALRNYALMHIHTCKHSEVHESQTNSWGIDWFVNWLMTWFMNWWVMK